MTVGASRAKCYAGAIPLQRRVRRHWHYLCDLRAHATTMTIAPIGDTKTMPQLQ